MHTDLNQPHQSPQASSPSPLLPLLAILLLAVGLRLTRLHESVWIDELYTSNLFVGHPLVLMKTLFSDIHPPLYFVGMHFWNALFGDSELSLRMPPLLCGLASVVVLFQLGRRVFDTRTGLIAALLLALSPVHIWYSQEGRPYSFDVLMLLVTTLAFVEVSGARAFRWSLAFFVGLFGIAFTHYYMAAFVFAFPVLAWFAKSPSRGRITWISGMIAVLVGAYIFAKASISHVDTGRSYLRAFDLAEAWRLFFHWFLTGNSLTPIGEPPRLAPLLWAIQGIGVLAVLLGILRSVKRGPLARTAGGHPWQIPLLALVLPGALFVLTLIGLDRTYIERSALPSLPLFLLVLAAGVGGIRRAWLANGMLTLTVAAAATALVGYFAFEGSWTVYKPRPDWRTAAAYLTNEIEHTDGVLRVYSDYVSPTPLTYYDPRIAETKTFVRNDRKVKKLLATTGRIFGTEGFPGGTIRTWLQTRLDEFDTRLDTDQRAMRAAIDQLSAKDPLHVRSRHDATRPFYVIVFGTVPPRVAKLVRACKKLATRQFRSLTIFKLQRHPS